MAINKKPSYPGAIELLNPRQLDADAREIEFKPDVPAEFRGSHTYRLSRPHYRLGVTYEAGTLVTVTDEKPGADWVKVSKAPEAEPIKK